MRNANICALKNRKNARKMSQMLKISRSQILPPKVKKKKKKEKRKKKKKRKCIYTHMFLIVQQHVDLFLFSLLKRPQKYRQCEREEKRKKENRKRQGNVPKCKTHVSPDEIRRRKKLQKS